jgi:hypothetical protein
MKFWLFKFEGWFSDDSAEYPGNGVFSECLVRATNFPEAEFRFLAALAEEKINLIKVEDNFPVDTDPRMMDLGNSDNLFWIEWCEETELAGKPTFEQFYLYPAEEVDREKVSGN